MVPSFCPLNDPRPRLRLFDHFVKRNLSVFFRNTLLLPVARDPPQDRPRHVPDTPPGRLPVTARRRPCPATAGSWGIGGQESEPQGKGQNHACRDKQDMHESKRESSAPYRTDPSAIGSASSARRSNGGRTRPPRRKDRPPRLTPLHTDAASISPPHAGRKSVSHSCPLPFRRPRSDPGLLGPSNPTIW